MQLLSNYKDYIDDSQGYSFESQICYNDNSNYTKIDKDFFVKCKNKVNKH